ncbi:unnamed protein product, partial [Notodromas monacha]
KQFNQVMEIFRTSGFIRSFHTCAVNCGKRNIRKFPFYNKAGTRAFKEKQMTSERQFLVDHLGVRPVGEMVNGRLRIIPEMVPELVVPDLSNCDLKPYVSYRAPEVTNAEFTARDLFATVYSDKIIEDFREGKINEDGSPLHPSAEERLKPDEAWAKARQFGSDIFPADASRIPDLNSEVPELTNPEDSRPPARYHDPTRVL